jgi:5-methylcytosine-specific restriction endonuclease McrA
MAIAGFRHSTNLRNDRRMRYIDRRHGNDGYATYLILMEMASQSPGFIVDVSSHVLATATAEECNLESVDRLYSILDDMASADLISDTHWQDRRVYSDDLVAENQSEIYARYRASVAREYKQYREVVCQRDGHKCVYCGAVDKLSLDHYIPLSRGGANGPENLVTACQPCNSSKRDKTPQEWLGGRL